MTIWMKRIIMNIKDMIKDKTVKFIFYKDLSLWYVTECGFEFPVPIEDTGTATFLPKDKAILFMRYIRKHIKCVEDGLTQQVRPIDETLSAYKVVDAEFKNV